MDSELKTLDNTFIKIFLASLSAMVLVIFIIVICLGYIADRDIKAAKEMFEKRDSLPYPTFEKQVDIRVEELRPVYERKFKNEKNIRVIVESAVFKPHSGQMCQKYYAMYKHEPTEENLDIAKQVCANFK